MINRNRTRSTRRPSHGLAGSRRLGALAAAFIALASPASAQVLTGPVGDNNAAPAAPGEQVWIGVGGKSEGPFASTQVRQKIDRGEITADTQVWSKALGRWTRAGDVPAFANLLNSGPPGPPPAPAADAGRPGNADRLKTFLVGEWTAEAPGATDGVTVRLIARYDAGGRYSGVLQTFISLDGSQPQLASTKPIEGTWKIQPLNERSFTLTLTGGNSGTVRLEIVDQNSLRDMDQDFVAVRTGA